MNGKSKNVVKELEKERDNLSKKEDFEGALKIQSKIDAINLITSPFYKPFEYEENPNLKDDVTSAQLNSLIEILNSNGVNVAKLERIECYDISNTQGTNATASMVVLTNGNIDKSQYRRFKIKSDFNNMPNDFGMIKEVIERRLHNSWQLPDLFLIDGGKGQVSSAKQILDKLQVQIPVIGLAKREETIITSDLKEIKLPKDSKALLMIMKIRDEAHRFAITYHKKLRSKSIFY